MATKEVKFAYPFANSRLPLFVSFGGDHDRRRMHDAIGFARVTARDPRRIDKSDLRSLAPAHATQRRFGVVLAALMLLSAFIGEATDLPFRSSQTGSAAEGLDIPDPRLRSALERILGKAPGESIAATDMAGLTTLSLANAGIEDLTGLEHATSVTNLNLSGNEIQELSPLEALPLWNLNLSANAISDIRPLAGVTSIFDLTLSRNAINDIGPLEGMSNMRRLFLSHNAITDIGALSGMRFLSTLEIQDNSVSEIEALADKTYLTRLVLADNSIVDISPLAGLFEQAPRGFGSGMLDLSGNMITDIAPLAGMINLRTLSLARNRLSNLSASALAELINLLELDLSENSISDLSFLATLMSNPHWVGFQRLKLARNSLADISVLEELADYRPNLRELDLSGNAISDVRPLVAFSRFSRLNLSDNRIADLGPLEAFRNHEFWYVNLAGNNIEDVAPLRGIRTLELDLSRNSISDGSPFVDIRGYAGSAHPKMLDLSHNALAEFPTFNIAARGSTLESLDVSHNSISLIPDPPPFVGIRELDLSHNPVVDIISLEPRHLPRPPGRLSEATKVADQYILGTLILYNTSLNEESTRHVKTLRDGGVIVATRTDPDHSTPVRFADAALRGAVVSQLGLSPGQPILAFDLETRLLSLRAPQASITNLSGLEHAANLRELSLPDNLIESVAPIENSTSMSWLDLSGNRITDLAPLRHITRLTRLNLSGNAISDLSRLRSWLESTDCVAGNLRHRGYHCIVDLDLSRNAISSLAVFLQIHGVRADHLTRLDLSDNDIEDISPLSRIFTRSGTGYSPSLAIDLSGNRIADISAAIGRSRLNWLDVSDNMIVDLPNDLGGALDWLDLTDNLIRDLGPLRAMDAIGVLSIWGNPIDDLAPLYEPDGIQALVVYLVCCNPHSGGPSGPTQASTYDPQEVARVRDALRRSAVYADPSEFLPADIPDANLRGIVGRELSQRAGFCRRDEFYPDGTCKRVYFSRNLREPHSIITRAEMARLVNLELDGVADLTGLEYAHNLGTIFTRYYNPRGPGQRPYHTNAISDISPLADKPDLAWLELPDNSITDISAIAASTKLARLILSGNQISDISVLAGFAGKNCETAFYVPSPTQGNTSIRLNPVQHQCLSYLDLSRNRISDVSALSSLAMDYDDDCVIELQGARLYRYTPEGICLGRLELSGNDILDAGPIGGLERLGLLDLSGNSVRDISPLSGLAHESSQLGRLDLADNQIIDVASLANMTRLVHLDLAGNKISDPAPLASLLKLEHLNLSDNSLNGDLRLDGISFEDAHSGYVHVDLSGNSLSDVSALTDVFRERGYHELTLKLARNAIENLGFLANMSDVTELDLSDNAISDIGPFEHLTSVRRLDLSGNLISDIAPLTQLLGAEDSDKPRDEWLLDLNLSRNRIDDLKPLASHVWRSLDLSSNLITDIAPLATPVTRIGFGRLSLSNNQISDISPLANLEMPTFEILDLSYNDISDIGPLEGFEIAYLYLAGNAISDTGPLASVDGLRLLDLSDNEITDPSPLKEIKPREVYLGGNPLEQDAIDELRFDHASFEVSLDNPKKLVDIPDPALRAAISGALHKYPSEPLTVSDLKGLHSLHVQDAGVESLVGLEFAARLHSLSLPGNSISDVSPLGQLGERIVFNRYGGGLKLLDLSRNDIEDISPLEPLISAVAERQNRTDELGRYDFGLRLSENRISDISALAQEGIVISTLELGGNAISDISPIADISGFDGLDLSDNRITSLAPLAEASVLPHYMEYFDLSGNRISDLGPLATYLSHNNFGNVHFDLNLARNQISDIEPLADFRVRRLDLSDNKVSNIRPLANITSVTHLNLSRNRISEVWPLRYLVRLLDLDLSDNSISDISALAGLFRLDATPRIEFGRLNLSGNRIADVSGLSGMTGLVDLDLSTNLIVDISPLSTLFRGSEPLRYALHAVRLNLSDNLISDISPLERMYMWELDLSRNAVTDIGPLRTMLDRLYKLEITRSARTFPLHLDGNPLSADSIKIIEILARLHAVVSWDRGQETGLGEDDTVPGGDDVVPDTEPERSIWRGWRLELLRKFSEESESNES